MKTTCYNVAHVVLRGNMERRQGRRLSGEEAEEKAWRREGGEKKAHIVLRG
jgi:hypothetical protein